MPAETVANTPANTVSEAEKAALLEFANELASELASELAKDSGISKDENTVANIISKIRWYPNKAGAVVIVKRGSDRKVLATISPNSGKWSKLYPSWKPVLAELATKKEQENVSRMSHDGLLTGEIPLAESEK